MKMNFINIGELVLQAERKVYASTHKPDLDNANVGTSVNSEMIWKLPIW